MALAALQPLFQEQLQYGELYKRNYYKEVKEKNRIHYELYSLDGTQEVPEDYKEISLVCVRKDGMYLGTDALSNMCSSIAKDVREAKKISGFSLEVTISILE